MTSQNSFELARLAIVADNRPAAGAFFMTPMICDCGAVYDVIETEGGIIPLSYVQSVPGRTAS